MRLAVASGHPEDIDQYPAHHQEAAAISVQG